MPEWAATLRPVRPRPGLEFLDRTLAVVTLLIVCVGIVAVYSATIASSRGLGVIFETFAHVALGVAACAALWLFVPLRTLRDRSWLLAVLSMATLLMVHIPVLGAATNEGVARWLDLGLLTVQPVEYTKVLVPLYVCAHCAAHRDRLDQLACQWQPLLMVAVAVVFLRLQPDYGSAVLITGLSLAVMFMAGMRLLPLAAIAGLCAALAAVAVLSVSYLHTRKDAFLDPFKDAYGAGWQQSHSLMAIGTGGWGGQGLGMSIEKLPSHLPEQHTDFIISVIFEETGIVGFVAVLALYALIVARSFLIARRAEALGRMFSALLARSIGLLLTAQVFINIGANLSLLPVKGLTLPLISKGGSSVVAWLLTLALLHMIDYENRGEPRPEPRPARVG